MGSSKSKGGGFEREVSSKLSLWWTNGKRTDIFYRTNSSGGRFTMRRKSGKDTSGQGGDIGFTDSIGKPLIDKWSIEVKTGYGKKTKDGITRWDALDILDSSQKQTVLEKMWEQSCRDAILTNREPILIFRRNGRKSCIMIKMSSFLDLKLDNTINNYIHLAYLSTFIIPLDIFFLNVSPKYFTSKRK